MRNFRPLRYHHVFRFESKNGQMKDIKIKYFINISYSISIRQQYWLAKKQAEAKLKKSIAFSGNEYVLLEEVCLLLTSILNLVLI